LGLPELKKFWMLKQQCSHCGGASRVFLKIMLTNSLHKFEDDLCKKIWCTYRLTAEWIFKRGFFLVCKKWRSPEKKNSKTQIWELCWCASRVNSKILTNGFHKFEENLSRDKSMHIERLKDISTTLFHMATKVMIETNPSLGHTTRMSQQQTEQLHVELPRQKFISQIQDNSI
jgi:hypothetical protein